MVLTMNQLTFYIHRVCPRQSSLSTDRCLSLSVTEVSTGRCLSLSVTGLSTDRRPSLSPVCPPIGLSFSVTDVSVFVCQPVS